MIRPVLAAAFVCLFVAGCGDTSGGSAQRTEGKVKEAAGSVIGDKDLKREGQTDQAVGGVKDAAHDVKEAVKDAAK